jgi:hypothetical protein
MLERRRYGSLGEKLAEGFALVEAESRDVDEADGVRRLGAEGRS